MKSESSLSQLLTKRSSRFVGVAVVLLLNGCGTSGSLQLEAAAANVETVETAPEPVMVAFERALQAMADGAVTEAELELEHLILEYPGYAGPYVNLAILYRASGRPGEAAETLGRALSVDPDHPAANNELGILLRVQGEFVEAETAYRRALATDPNYSLAYYNLGILLDLYLQRPADALPNYERYQDLISEPDITVAGWIIDLRRRLGIADSPPRTAQEIAR